VYLLGERICVLLASQVGDKVKELRSGTEGVIVEIDLDEKFYPIFALFPTEEIDILLTAGLG
jgi:hypothetical protein